MPWYDPVSTLTILIKGLFIGFIVSAPMGPVGVLCIQRTLRKGRAFGLVTGVGAAMSDIIYAMITGAGMSLVMDFITNVRNLFVLQLVGSVMLSIFGIYMFRSDPGKCFRPASGNKGTLLHNLVTSFLVTLSNPLIIFLFIALFARFAFVVPNQPVMQLVGYLSIIGGAMIWWIVLTYFVNKLKVSFSIKGVRILNRTLGVIVLIAAAVGLVFTLSGLNAPYSL